MHPCVKQKVYYLGSGVLGLQNEALEMGDLEGQSVKVSAFLLKLTKIYLLSLVQFRHISLDRQLL